MKPAILMFVLITSAFAQTAQSARTASKPLKIELRANSSNVRINDAVGLSVYFRSPDTETTLWNALGWGPEGGLQLIVTDPSGREVPVSFAPFYHPIPPDLTGKNTLISIAGPIFAGFDSQVPVDQLFPRPGTYELRCSYQSPLPRGYFPGRVIWGKEDGRIESAPITIMVDK